MLLLRNNKGEEATWLRQGLKVNGVESLFSCLVAQAVIIVISSYMI